MNPEVLRAVTAALLFMVAFIAVGGRLLLLAPEGWDARWHLRLIPVAAALGFALYSYLAIPVLLIRPKPGAGLILVMLLAALPAGRKYFQSVAVELWRKRRWLTWLSRHPLRPVAAVCVLGFFGLCFLSWCTPVREGDALTGYMFTGRWLYENGLEYNPINPHYSLMPFNTELIYALCFASGTELSAKVLCGLLGVAFIAAVYEFSRRYNGGLASVLAALSLGTMEDFTSNWGNGKVDVICSFILFAAVSLLFVDPDRAISRYLLVLSAFLAGTACAQKYIIWVFAPFYLGLVIYRRPVATGLRWRQLALAAGVVFACLVPHFARAVAQTGNPIAPFGGELIPSRNIYLSQAPPFSASLAQTLAAPYTAFFDPSASDGASRFPGPFPLMLLVAVPFFVIRKDKHADVALLAKVVGLLFLVWFWAMRERWLVPRYLLAPLGMLIIVGAAGFDELGRHRGLLRGAVVLIVGMLTLHGLWYLRQWRYNLPFVHGKESREAWYERTAPYRAQGTLQRISARLGPGCRLMLGTGYLLVPTDKLPLISTERELKELYELPESEKVPFLKRNGFAYVFWMGMAQDRSNAPWLDQLLLMDKYVPRDASDTWRWQLLAVK